MQLACKRRAPVIAPELAIEHDDLIRFRTRQYIEPLWPDVDKHKDWCGDYEMSDKCVTCKYQYGGVNCSKFFIEVFHVGRAECSAYEARDGETKDNPRETKEERTWIYKKRCRLDEKIKATGDQLRELQQGCPHANGFAGHDDMDNEWCMDCGKTFIKIGGKAQDEP